MRELTLNETKTIQGGIFDVIVIAPHLAPTVLLGAAGAYALASANVPVCIGLAVFYLAVF